MRNKLYYLYLVGISYVLFEIFVAICFYWQPNVIWIIERGDKPAIHFDAFTGFRYHGKNTRHAKVSKHHVEYCATIYGNNLGFPDKHDFSPDRQQNSIPRICVLGDSFSAATYLETNWPDRVEELAQKKGTPIELLNFSLDGAGIANWWGIVTHILVAQSFQIDGIVFALFDSNYSRPLIIADQDGYDVHMSAYLPGFGPSDWPKTPQEAAAYLKPLPGYIVSKDIFDQAIRGHLSLVSKEFQWQPISVHVIKRFLPLLLPTVSAETQETYYSFLPNYCTPLLSDIKKYIQTNGLGVLVIRIPSLQEIYDQSTPDPGIVQWHEIVGGKFIDGIEAFTKTSCDAPSNYFLKYDRHWNQKGSDTFAQAFYKTIIDWAYEIVYSSSGHKKTAEQGTEAWTKKLQ